MLQQDGYPLPQLPDEASWPPLSFSDTVGDSAVACVMHLAEEWEKLPRPD